jgi:alkylation response protein AidB-like acyl-CoA dehydrogenase
MKKGYELGYHTIFLPDSYGGLATDPIETHIILEELAWGSVEFRHRDWASPVFRLFSPPWFPRTG